MQEFEILKPFFAAWESILAVRRKSNFGQPAQKSDHKWSKEAVRFLVVTDYATVISDFLIFSVPLLLTFVLTFDTTIAMLTTEPLY